MYNKYIGIFLLVITVIIVAIMGYFLTHIFGEKNIAENKLTNLNATVINNVQKK